MAAKTVPRGLLGGSWVVLGGSWTALGGSWSPFGWSFGIILGRLGVLLGPFGVDLLIRFIDPIHLCESLMRFVDSISALDSLIRFVRFTVIKRSYDARARPGGMREAIKSAATRRVGACLDSFRKILRIL